jgi:hypothetical protein
MLPQVSALSKGGGNVRLSAHPRSTVPHLEGSCGAKRNLGEIRSTLHNPMKSRNGIGAWGR